MLFKGKSKFYREFMSGLIKDILMILWCIVFIVLLMIALF